MNNRLIAITGGIGSGKSVVSAILRIMGYEVYDCDFQAKRIMDTDLSIVSAIGTDICAEAIRPDRTIDRTILANTVFNDANALQRLNALVHHAVRRHLTEWSAAPTHARVSVKFVETAILYQSGLDRMVHEVWEVTAPEGLRIRRVMQRNGLTRHEVESRIAAQAYSPERPHATVRRIANGETDALLPQILGLLAGLRNYNRS